MISRLLKAAVATSGIFLALANTANAHPHVFVEANMEIVLDDKNRFTELRHVWRFDELFSTTMIIDFDDNANGELDAAELKNISGIVKQNIAEYDFYTAIRNGADIVPFFEPDEIITFVDDGQLYMVFKVEPENPFAVTERTLKISASDTSYYVAFDFLDENVKVEGGSGSCSSRVILPDYDKLYESNQLTLTEAFFNDPTNAGSLGDEFYSWANITC